MIAELKDSWTYLEFWERICTIVFFPILLPLCPAIVLLRCGGILGNWVYIGGILAIASAQILFYIAGLLHPWYCTMMDKHWTFFYILLPIFIYFYMGVFVSFFIGFLAIIGQIIRNIREMLHALQ